VHDDIAPLTVEKRGSKPSKRNSRKSRYPVRFVTATSLFDGHDAAINVMRRILQAAGAEVIHLGHDRSVNEMVTAAVEEDVHGIAISSYQGGHIEYFKYLLDEVRKVREWVLESVRGTVQADILKKDQGQNACIFSTEFALRLMADVQEYFIHNRVRNFYSVSISGYHIAEAGANPITQLALTLANGFTYVESYLARGMKVDDFAPNQSFFFSMGMDPEYSVMGRVARRVWSTAMRFLYGAGEYSQKLKYHTQTSGRSLHTQEMAFNDLRTTLQALIGVYDNCNSMHTNAYDEAFTTPTAGSARRALAIQLIINREWGLAKSENINQGSFVMEELTDLVEEAVLQEFERLSERGGVLGAMETGYQRGKIQDESLYYETRKHDGTLPLIGVNTPIRRGRRRPLNLRARRNRRSNCSCGAWAIFRRATWRTPRLCRNA